MRVVFFEHFGDVRRPVAPDPSWRAGSAMSFAAVIYADRAFELLPVLADAL